MGRIDKISGYYSIKSIDSLTLEKYYWITFRGIKNKGIILLSKKDEIPNHEIDNYEKLKIGQKHRMLLKRMVIMENDDGTKSNIETLEYDELYVNGKLLAARNPKKAIVYQCPDLKSLYLGKPD